MEDYSDIIDKIYVSKRNKMPISDRAAIFNPFAALTGYQEAINEAGRLVDKKIDLTEDEQNDLNDKITFIMDNKNTRVSVIYFVKDKKKNGGKYLTQIGLIKKINLNDRIILINNLKISFDNLYKINILD